MNDEKELGYTGKSDTEQRRGFVDGNDSTTTNAGPDYDRTELSDPESGEGLDTGNDARLSGGAEIDASGGNGSEIQSQNDAYSTSRALNLEGNEDAAVPGPTGASSAEREDPSAVDHDREI